MWGRRKDKTNLRGWRPLETAPKDGSSILGVAASAYSPRAFLMWWRGDVFVSYHRPEKFVAGGVSECFPTHWRPLPDPPTVPQDGFSKAGDAFARRPQ